MALAQFSNDSLHPPPPPPPPPHFLQFAQQLIAYGLLIKTDESILT